MSNISKCKICNCHDYINEYINGIHVQKLETSLNWYPILTPTFHTGKMGNYSYIAFQKIGPKCFEFRFIELLCKGMFR